jgi:GST-like protein
VWGWARLIPYVIADNAFDAYPHLKRLVDEISARPAALRVNALKEKFVFKTEMDDEAKRFMFPQNAALTA